MKRRELMIGSLRGFSYRRPECVLLPHENTTPILFSKEIVYDAPSIAS
jgi:hypothetical protein